MGELKNVLDVSVFGLGQGAGFTSFGEELLHLLPGDEGVSFFWFDAEKRQDGPVGEGQKPDGGDGGFRQEVNRPNDTQGHAVRVLKTDGLRGQLSQV